MIILQQIIIEKKTEIYIWVLYDEEEGTFIRQSV